MFQFHYDYRQIDLFDLREAGIRTFGEVEDMIEGYSVADRVPGPGRFYEYVGFTRESKPLEVTIKEGDDVDIVVVRIRKPTVDVIVDQFCKHYRSTDPNA